MHGLQFHRRFVAVLDGYGRGSHASIDIGDNLRHFLHLALSPEDEVALAALVDHVQVSVHALRAARSLLWAVRSLTARAYLTRRHSFFARFAILLSQGLIAGERLHSGHGACSHVFDLEELFQVVLSHPVALFAVMVVIHTGLHPIVALITLI